MSFGGNYLYLKSGGNVGIGETTPLGKLHIKSGDSGVSSANANADDLIVENSDYTGISILGENESNIHFGDNEDPDVGRIEYLHSVDRMSFRTGGTDRIKVDSDGLKFGTDTAAANALDDYEEGTHTATITPTGGSVTMNSSVDDLAYVKIGRQVTVTGMITVASVSSPTGYFNISLPFSIGSWGGSYGNRCTGSLWINPKTGGGNVADYIVYGIQGESQFRVYLGDTTSIQADSAQTLYATVDIILSITYLTN